MNIFIELPTWLGDTVMTTPAIENIVQKYPDAKITIFGSFVSIEALKNHPNVIHAIIDNSKKSNFRFVRLYKIAKSLGAFDFAFSFRRPLSSKIFLFFLNAENKFSYQRYTKDQLHQVIRYNDFINRALNSNFKPSNLKLYYKPKQFLKPTLGINPGATYGSAKRWYPERFAKVAKELSSSFDIVIFGGSSEVNMAKDIEKLLKKEGVENFSNLSGKTTIPELIEKIAGLSLFITGDSGPMHVAAAFEIPTVSLFGPTKYLETSQWQNQHSTIIRHNLDCSPCMKRKCPIKTHDCMKLIKTDEVIKEAKKCYNASQKNRARKY